MVDDIVRHSLKSERGVANLVTVALEDRISALTTKDPEKIKVYAGSKQYEVEVNGTTHRITEDTVVNFDGKQIKGAELYERLQNRKP